MNKQRLQQFESQLKAFIQRQSTPAPQIREAIEYVLFPGGKRLRPHLVYLTGDLLAIPLHIIERIAMSVELIHAYSLVHDDLPAMDDDDFRRGRLSCHKAFDEATAILTGDALHALAILALTDPPATPASVTLEMLNVLIKATGPGGMISGQSLDLIELAQAAPLSEARLNTIHDLKTTALIRACVHMPLLATSPVQQAQYRDALQDFATAFGLAFQMQNDYLDRYQPALVGKQHASDLANQKQTFATLYDMASLQALIQKTYERATQALSVFGEPAQAIRSFTNDCFNATICA